MGQIQSRLSTPVKRDSGEPESLDEELSRSLSLLDRPSHLEEGESAYHSYSSMFQNIDSKSRYIPTKSSFCRTLTLRRIRFFTHRPSHLVLAVRRYIRPRGTQLTDKQEEAIRKWNEIDILNYTDQLRFVPTQKILEKCFQIFDDLFFGGTLKNNLTIFASQTNYLVTGKKGIANQNFDRTTKSLHSKSTITIYNYQYPIFGKRMENFFSTLIHEMCHAFFQVYGCFGNCCRGGSLELGSSGHGIMFQEMAYDIERMAARKDVLGFDLDLSRYMSLLTDIRDEADWRDQMDVTRWGFDKEKTANDLIIYKTRGLFHVFYEI